MKEEKKNLTSLKQKADWVILTMKSSFSHVEKSYEADKKYLLP
jgi:hypothetical protein